MVATGVRRFADLDEVDASSSDAAAGWISDGVIMRFDWGNERDIN